METTELAEFLHLALNAAEKKAVSQLIPFTLTSTPGPPCDYC